MTIEYRGLVRSAPRTEHMLVKVPAKTSQMFKNAEKRAKTKFKRKHPKAHVDFVEVVTCGIQKRRRK